MKGLLPNIISTAIAHKRLWLDKKSRKILRIFLRFFIFASLASSRFRCENIFGNRPMTNKIKVEAVVFFLIFSVFAPGVARADEAGSVTEDFSGTSRREERATYAFWDTRNKEISLPLRYSVRALAPPTTFPPTSSSNSQFSAVAQKFPRVPAGKIRTNALIADDGINTYAAGPGLYASIGGGIELTGGRVSELYGAEVKQLQSGQGVVIIGGRKGGKNVLIEFALQEFVPSAAVESKKMLDAGSGKFFKSATVFPQLEVSEGTSVTVMLSGDGGQHWEEITAGVAHEFIHKGGDLRYRATLASVAPAKTPHLIKLKIDFIKAPYETPAAIRARDNKRVSDLKNLAIKLEKFKKDLGVYPIADDPALATRWSILGQLLKDGRYLDKIPQDPQHDIYSERMYDYIASKSGAGYVARARLEDPTHKSLENDLDGKPVEPNAYEYSCDDPWYCEGKGLLIRSITVSAAPAITGTAELLQDQNGKVYRIAAIGGGATPAEKRKLYLPSPALLNRLRTFYGRMQKAGQGVIAEVPRARLVKTADKNDIYYLTETNLKRRLPSWEVFKSYGNDRREVVIVKSEELAAYPESQLIRLVGDSRIWYIEGGGKRLINSPAIMRKHGFKWENVSPVNFAEYNSYPEGQPLQ